MALFDAFMDGITAAGLFGKLRWPGAPTELIDTRSPGEFDGAAELRRLGFGPVREKTSAPRAGTPAASTGVNAH